MRTKSEEFIWSLLRLGIGWVYLWAFLDKTFGLGFATEYGKGWIDGGSPTYGYLMFGTKGPFVEFFKALAASELVEWLFMLGILAVGITLTLGVFVRFGALTAAVFYVLFYVSGFIPPVHNPFLDEHIINFIIVVGVFITTPRMFGLGRWWQKIPFIKNRTFLY